MDSRIDSKKSKSDLNEIKASERKKIEILNFLESSQFGVNFSQIADRLSISRSTVKKYLYLLESENLVKIKQIGRSKICYSAKNIPNLQTIGNFYFLILSEILKAFEAESPDFIGDENVINNFIKRVSGRVNVNSFLPFMKNIKLTKIDEAREDLLDRVLEASLQFSHLLNKIFGTLIKVEPVPSPKSDDKSLKKTVVRVEILNNDLKSSKSFYYSAAGFFESILQENFGHYVYFNVLNVMEDNSCCYYELGIQEIND